MPVETSIIEYRTVHIGTALLVKGFMDRLGLVQAIYQARAFKIATAKILQRKLETCVARFMKLRVPRIIVVDLFDCGWKLRDAIMNSQENL